MNSRTFSQTLMTTLLVLVMFGAAISLVPLVQGGGQPDLTLSHRDIHMDTTPEEGDDVEIYATIHNDGDGDATNVTVKFTDYSHSDKNWTTIGTKHIHQLTSGSSENVSVVWEAKPQGNHTIYVEVDPDGHITESNETNNEADKDVQVQKHQGGNDTILQGYTKKDSDSTHIPKVSMSIQQEKGNFSETFSSDGNGWYEVTLPEGGTYNIRAEKDGYEDFEVNLSVQEGKTTTYHVRMTESSGGDTTEVSGYVFEKESRGTPIENAEITITGKSGNDTYTAYSDRNGYYEQELEEGDNYTLTAEKEGYTSETKHQYIADGESAEVNFHLEKESGSEKTILKGYTKEDQNSTHIPHVWISVSQGNYSETTESDKDGYYEFELEEGGTYHVQAEKDGYEDHESNVSVEEGKETTYHIRMTESSGGDKTMVSGYVYEKESRGTPIENAEITITGHSANETYTTYTDRNGHYEKELGGGDNYTLTAEKEGYTSETKYQYIAEGESEEVNFHLEKESGSEKTTLKGYTKEKTNSTHIPKVWIRVSKGNYSEPMYSDDNGYYEFELEEGGTYHIRAEKDGYEDYESNVSVEEGKETTHHIWMDEEGDKDTYVLGYVFKHEGRGGTPIHDATVTITDISCNCTSRTYTDEEGYYQYKLPGEGNYSVRVEKDGYNSQKEIRHIEKGEEKRIDFYMRIDTPILKGHIWEDSRGGGIPGVEVNITRGEYSFSTQSDLNGYYEIELEHPSGNNMSGTYTVLAWKDGYEPFEGSATVDEEKETIYDIYLTKDDSESTHVNGYVKDKPGITPLIPATVTITGLECNCSYTAETNQHGYYEIELSLEGNYTITASFEGYATETRTIFVEEGKTTTANFHLQRVVTILSGNVWPETRGGGIEGVSIYVTSDHEEYETTTDRHGYYEVSLEEGGTYTVTASKDGYVPQTKVVTIETGESGTVDFHLTDDPSVTVADHLFLRDHDKLSTTLPIGSPATTKSVAANYTQHPGVRTNRQWVDVGTWESDPFTQQHVLREDVTFSLWFMVEPGDYIAEPDWEFTLYRNDAEILSATITGSEESEEHPIQISVTGSLESDVLLSAGDTLSVEISYNGWEDATVYYGNVTYDSGMEFNVSPGFAKPAKDRFGVDINAEFDTIDLEDTDRTVITLTVTNTGQEDDTYSLSLAGSYKGWKATYDSPDTITVKAGTSHIVTLTLTEDATLSPDGDEIIVELVVRSQTYPDVYDSAQIKGKLKTDSPIPDLTVPFIIASLSVGALVASFRRRY